MSNPPKKWCIYGAGRAGKARLRSAASVPSVDAAIFSARESELHEILKSGSFDGVVVCTENQRHAADVRVALDHGCDVIVEFPLAPDQKTAANLYEHAREQGNKIHCEHVGLLRSMLPWLRTRWCEKPFTGVEVAFEGGLYRWVEKAYENEQAGLLAVGRLQVLWDLCGPLKLRTTNYQDLRKGYELSVSMQGKDGCRIQLTEKRQPELQRGSRWRFFNEDGEVTPPEAERGELFLRDWRAALAFFEGGDTYLKAGDVLEVLSLTDEIGRMIKTRNRW